MKKYVADTHALFWYLTASRRLSPVAKRAFDEADRKAAVIYVPAIVLAELYYTNRKEGWPLIFADTVRRLSAAAQFVLLPDAPDDVLDFDANAAIPEMHDRMIAGCAIRLGATLITRDLAITSTGLVPTVWSGGGRVNGRGIRGRRAWVRLNVPGGTAVRPWGVVPTGRRPAVEAGRADSRA